MAVSALRIGPIAVVVVPEVRKSFGWKPVARPPTTYPRQYSPPPPPPPASLPLRAVPR